MSSQVSVYFIGAGPGALDLLTLRAWKIIQEADLILCADSLVNPRIAELAKPGAQMLGSARMALEEVTELMVKTAREGRLVARVHSGDPSIYGAIGEQMHALAEAGIGFAVVPGVSSLFGAAAALGVELTIPQVSQTVIVTRAEGRTGVPERERLRDLARHQSTMAVFLSVGMVEKVVGELTEGGYPWDTPAAVVYRATWPEQLVMRGTISEIASAVRAAGISRQALILVGEALRPQELGHGSPRSRLYSPDFRHSYRGGADEKA